MVGLDMLSLGFQGALERFRAARMSKERDLAFIALAESLNWFVMLDTWLERHDSSWQRQRDATDVAAGIRFARNHVQHQWADAIELTDGGEFPMGFPLTFHDWRWRRLADLPAQGRDRRGSEAYTGRLAGTPVRKTLTELADLLKPHLARNVDLTGLTL